MNWIVLVLIACSGDSCTVVESEAKIVPEVQEIAIRKRCEPLPNCFEMRPGFFILRQLVPASPPAAPPVAPPAPPPPASSNRAPGSRA